MKIYSSVITREDIMRTLYGMLPQASHEDFREIENPRKTHAITATNSDGVGTGLRATYKRGFELFLRWDGPAGRGTDHARKRNGRDGYALTWAEYGQWFARLFDIDPNAWISGWDGVQKFHEGTNRQFAPYSRKLGGGAHDVPTAVEARLYHACPTRAFRLALGDPYIYNGPHA